MRELLTVKSWSISHFKEKEWFSNSEESVRIVRVGLHRLYIPPCLAIFDIFILVGGNMSKTKTAFGHIYNQQDER